MNICETMKVTNLSTVDDPLVTLLFGASLETSNIGSGARLSHAVSSLTNQKIMINNGKIVWIPISITYLERLRSHTTEVFLLLLLVTGNDNRGFSETVTLNGSHHTSATVGELFMVK